MNPISTCLIGMFELEYDLCYSNREVFKKLEDFGRIEYLGFGYTFTINKKDNFHGEYKLHFWKNIKISQV